MNMMFTEQEEQSLINQNTNISSTLNTMATSLTVPSSQPPSRPRTLLSRYLIGDDDDDGIVSGVSAHSKPSIDEEFERHVREELNCIQVISPRLDSKPNSFGSSVPGGNDPMEALRNMSERVNFLATTITATATTTTTTTTTTNNETINEVTNQQRSMNIWSDDTIETSTPKRSQYRITFEIVKARIVFDGNAGNASRRSRYVNYTILVKRVPGLDSHPAIIERRYSDFHAFHTAIKRRYSTLLKDVPFPRKIFLGNFSPEIISDRCQAFKTFLTYCLSVPEIRGSREFASFLYYPELREAKRHLTVINLEEAGFIFENLYHLQEKLMTLSGQPTAQLIHTACCLVGCYNAIDNRAEARLYAERTFEILFEKSTVISPTNQGGSQVNEVTNFYESVDLVIPLILLSLRLCWFSGAKKMALENKAEELCRLRGLPRNFDSQPTLLERLLKKDFQPILDVS